MDDEEQQEMQNEENAGDEIIHPDLIAAAQEMGLELNRQ
jgi:hypothetical protein